MRNEVVTYYADGLSMQARLFIGEQGSVRKPGVLVFPDAYGLTEHTLIRAARLAEHGYLALACDLHGQGQAHEDPQEITTLIGALSAEPSRIRARANGALQALSARPEADPQRIAAVGFCFGGTMALELARSGAALAATVGFHSGLSTQNPRDALNIKGKVLVCLGASDPIVPEEQWSAFRTEMNEAQVSWQMHIYGGVYHSFTKPDANKMNRPDLARYDASADASSERAMLALFDEVFGHA